MEGKNQEKLNKTEELERRRNDAEGRINKFKDKIMRNFSEEEQKILEQNIDYLINISAGSEEFESVSRDLWMNKEGSEEVVIKLLADFSKGILHNIKNIKESGVAYDFMTLLLKNGKRILQEKFWGAPTEVLDFRELKKALQKIENFDASLIQEFASSSDFKDLIDFYKKNEQIILIESGHPVAEEFYKKLSDALLKLFTKEKPAAAGVVVPEREAQNKIMERAQKYRKEYEDEKAEFDAKIKNNPRIGEERKKELEALLNKMESRLTELESVRRK